MNLDKLNSEQRKATLHKDGPMLVLAGAGSGKTSVLTNRIAYLIEEGIAPYHILAITFTNKAAGEMKERVIKLIGSDAYECHISTFHSLGVRILRENYKTLGYEKNVTILDSDDTLTIIKKIIKNMNLSTDFYNAKNIKNKISSAKNELIDVIEFSKKEYDKKIVEIYKRYTDKLKASNSVDFDDLLILPIRLFKENPDVLDHYQNRFRYILIDEYQDTNEAQYVFCKMLANKYRNLFVVGDESQSIYGFRGSNYKNILNFENDYPDTKVILLEQNYRSTKTILDAANSLIKNNKERKDKKLWSENAVGKKIKYVRVDNEKEEAIFVVKNIKELLEKKETPEEIAVLYRTNAQSRVIEEEMLKGNIPYRIVGSFYFYNRKEIKDLLSYLRLIYNDKDDASFLRVINTPKRGIGSKSIEDLGALASEKGISLYDAISKDKELKFKALIEEMKLLSENMTLTEMVEMVLDKSGMKKELLSEKTIESELRLENLEEFKSITKNYEDEMGVVSLEDFLEQLTLVSDVSEHRSDEGKVSLMTTHAVKGLEFNNVFVIGMEEGIFPHYNAIYEGGISAIEEERRLCYVAITRAKENLWLLNAKRRMLMGQTQLNPPSRFLDEIDSQYLEIEKEPEEKKSVFGIFKKPSSNYNTDDISYETGEVIKHEEYGEGIIVAIDKSIITVAFSYPYGTKKLMKNHKSISKI